ncbi:MAG: CPBP family intramembrane metalloprotease [Tannerella sp.]|jgi:membrane protease YdiL (CAAX protease family)|nr:CPBP family intramembrane metalloprotease [Tannerella sp.]
MATRNFLERALTGENQWWKYLMVFLVIVFGGSRMGHIPYYIVSLIQSIQNTGVSSENTVKLFSKLPSNNLAFGLMMLGPAMTLVLAIILIKAIHNRNFSETVNGTNSVRWNKTLFAFAVGFALMTIFWGVDYFLHADNYVFQLNWSRFSVLFVLSIVLLPLMAISEQLIFSGYLLQGVGAGTHSRWWALIIPPVIVGLLHSFDSPEVKQFGMILSTGQYLFLGLLFGLIAILDDGIELSIGLYAALEVFLALFITYSTSLVPTDAVFDMQKFDPFRDVISQITVCLIAFFIFYKKYGWSFRIMNERVGEPR